MSGAAVFINPGSGPAQAYGHTLLRQAWRSIRVFRRDLGLDGVSLERRTEDDEDGRYCFRLKRRNKHCDVMMPGLILDKVRYRMDTTDNAWHFPRLLIGRHGSSWLWPFTLNDAKWELTYVEEGRDE